MTSLSSGVRMSKWTSDTKPPYGGYGTYRGFVDQMGNLHAEGHFPQVIDRSVMGSRGGSARSELYIALRFFGLIDDEKRPTPRFQQLVAEPTPEKFRALVESAYADVIALDLNTATSRQVDSVIAGLGAPPSTVSRARTFFLNAAEETGISVGQLLRSAPRAPTSGRKRPKPKPKPEVVDLDPTPVKGKRPALISALIDKLPAEAEGWTEAEARQWLALVTPTIAYDYKLDLAKLTAGGHDA